MTQKVDITKKYCTRDGRDVKLFTIEGRDPVYPVVGEVLSNGLWVTTSWTDNGQYTKGFPGVTLDLIEVTEKKRLEGFLNICENGSVYHWATKEGADAARHNSAHPVVSILDLSKYNIEYEIGEGL